MIRSNFALSRLLLLPFGVLLLLYLLVVGSGATWLYYEVRNDKTQLLMAEVLAAIEPLVQKLRMDDAVGAMEREEVWLVEDVKALFADMSSLRGVAVRDFNRGFELHQDKSGGIGRQSTSPLAADAMPVSPYTMTDQNLHASSKTTFLIQVDLRPEAALPVRLDFIFDRSLMLARLDAGMAVTERTMQWLVLACAVGGLMAIAITVFAMYTTRKLEGHFQELYQRAAITELAASLVHDLRNPLAALRANAKALLVTPEQVSEIVDELDRDIVALNVKLSGFLNLTRGYNETIESVEIGDLIDDAARLAEPILTRLGLHVETDIPDGLPALQLRKASMRDALLNILINAGQSGQQGGSIRVAARIDGNVINIITEDKGAGIPAEHLPHIFDAFYSSRPEGNGLGLAIVQRVVTAHQGHVLAENRKQGGTRITVSLPLKPKETPPWWSKLKKTFPA